MKQVFQTLIKQHQQLVYSQAMYILANTSDAEDATQEAYIRLWAHMNKSQESASFHADTGKAWL